MAYRYTVRATFVDEHVAQEWVNWLKTGHCQEVLDRGATQVEIVEMDGEQHTFEVRYDFPDPKTFGAYEDNHAPRLRAEGLERFPTTRGVQYTRSTGVVRFRGSH